ncbi:MAG: UDP-N-acetylmuramoyl-L-alanine--D-glutamate ligase [Planctomycetes bacterium]|nr:UDP-N-acetylmuramoyl-L-alanine--D-glutamate ligase [Planctomycetota bacterium]
MFLRDEEPLSAFRGRKVTVMGLGLFGGGKGVTEFLCRYGAEVTVTDKRPAAVLEPTVAELRHLPVRWVLGEHREEDFLGADLVVPNPAVPRDAPLLELCRRKGIPLETEMNLFFKRCRGRICAVTGSNGKTTTTSLAGAMAARRWPSVLVGGNLGRSLLPDVESIAPGDWVVLEVSSFQLEDLRPLDRRPEVALVTNLSPNHLDRHGTYAEYLAAKREILGPAAPPACAVLNGDDPVARSWAGTGGRRVLFFGRSNRVRSRARGAWLRVDRGDVSLWDGEEEALLFESADLQLAGQFNVLNAAGAAAAAWAMGVGPGEIREAVRAFRAVEHRLEPVVEIDGVRYLNDSIATTPESTIAALDALGPNVVVICGGSPKGCSFRSLGQAIARRSRGCVLLGQTAEAIEAVVPRKPGGPPVLRAGSLEAAVAEARRLARPGDLVILSPACPSFDMFVNFVDRGRRFKDIARRLAGAAT